MISPQRLLKPETSSHDDKSYFVAWERSNRLALNLIEMTMIENIKSLMPKTDSCKEFVTKPQLDIVD